jgi:hypothetical protein
MLLKTLSCRDKLGQPNDIVRHAIFGFHSYIEAVLITHLPDRLSLVAHTA